MDSKVINVSNEDIRNLVNAVSDDVVKLRNKIILGVFNDKIPVLLRMPEGARSLLNRTIFNFNGINEYKIQFINLLGEWEISVGEQDEVLFKFYIPEELRKILANLTDEEIVDSKQRHMSTLVFTHLVGTRAITTRLQISSEWLENIRRNFTATKA